MFKIYLKENQFFLYAVLMHIVLFFVFYYGSYFHFSKNSEKFSYLNVKTYSHLPFEKTINKQKIKINKINETNKQLSDVQKRMLSYYVEPIKKSDKDKNKLKNKKIENALNKNFNSIDKDIDKQNKDIFKNSQNINTLAKVYGYIKKENQKLELRARSTKNKEKLLKSKILLLDYEDYQKALFSKIFNNWAYPKYAKNWSCTVEVFQTQEGYIKSIKYLKCNDDKRFRRAVKLALLSSSPLPLPSDKKVFNSSIIFTFKAN